MGAEPALTRLSKPARDAYVSHNALERSSRELRDLAGELELDQRDRYRAGVEPGAFGKQVDVGRIVAQLREDPRSIALGRRRAARQRAGGSPRRGQAQLFQDILRRLDELGAFLDQAMAPFRKRRMNRAGNRKHFAALLRGKARSDERAAVQRRLDDQDTADKAADHAIAAREISRQRGRAQ